MIWGHSLPLPVSSKPKPLYWECTQSSYEYIKEEHLEVDLIYCLRASEAGKDEWRYGTKMHTFFNECERFGFAKNKIWN